jgi:hypothetical protein
MSSYTSTSTFTIANARYVTSKIKADLKLLQRAYGDPSNTAIDAYGEEAAHLLNEGLLDTVTFGYRRNDAWILALSYTARSDGTLSADDRAGHIPRGADVAGASFYSYLTYSAKWSELTVAEQQAVESTLPVDRTPAAEPGTIGGYWTDGKSYSSNGSGVARRTFRPL